MNRKIDSTWTTSTRSSACLGPDQPSAAWMEWEKHPHALPACPAGQPVVVPGAIDAAQSFHARLNKPLTEPVIAQLRSGARLVVAGQQPGLMLGPMYTLYKAVTAIRLAQTLQQIWKVPVLPAFWIASEDHDLEEVSRCWAGGSQLRLDHGAAHRGQAVGAVELSSHQARLLDFMRDRIGREPFGGEILKWLESASAKNYREHFGSLLLEMLGGTGLVVLDALELLDAAQPVLQKAWDRRAELQQVFDAGRASGQPAPIQRLGFFAIDASGRRRAVENGGLRPGEKWSSGAALRPVIQDLLLPVAVQVSGPSEMQYLNQIRPLYDVLEAKPALAWPRFSATILQKSLIGQCREQNWLLPDLFSHAETPALPAGTTNGSAEDNAFQDLIQNALQHLDDRMQKHPDQTLDKARRSIAYQSRRVMERLKMLEHEPARVRRLRKRLAVCLRPGGVLQERQVSPLEFFARYGQAGVAHLLKLADPLAVGHHLIVSSEEGAA